VSHNRLQWRMKIPEFEGLFDMHSEYLLPGMFYLRDAMCVCACVRACLRACVRATHAGIVSKRLHGSSRFSAYTFSSTCVTLRFREMRVFSKNKGTSLWNLVPYSELMKFDLGTSTVAERDINNRQLSVCC